MKLTHSHILEIISDYTSSSKGSVTLQSLILNSFMSLERKLSISKNHMPNSNLHM